MFIFVCLFCLFRFTRIVRDTYNKWQQSSYVARVISMFIKPIFFFCQISDRKHKRRYQNTNASANAVSTNYDNAVRRNTVVTPVTFKRSKRKKRRNTQKSEILLNLFSSCFSPVFCFPATLAFEMPALRYGTYIWFYFVKKIWIQFLQSPIKSHPPISKNSTKMHFPPMFLFDKFFSDKRSTKRQHCT